MYDITSLDNLMQFNLRAQKILTECMKFTSNGIDVFDTGIIMPGLSDVSLSSATSCQL